VRFQDRGNSRRVLGAPHLDSRGHLLTEFDPLLLGPASGGAQAGILVTQRSMRA
jgi:hypothetical protein